MKPTSRPDPALDDAGAADGLPVETVAPRVRYVRREGQLIPIGPERLEALREAIRTGAYGVEDAARRGLERLLRSEPPSAS